ncbi:hypothetical protein C8Z91_23835 [Paenibacillus elgii]|uniref:DNA-binding response regulator n=2 Tax=Paenibacillus elgii TaxID=189691 RepID=A0A2T6FX08_9BACL|nr:hypothetical protein C8Z91_23835 [Paenibacillus elgii]
MYDKMIAVEVNVPMNKLQLEGPILIADDDASLVSFLQEYFGALNCRVLAASDGQRAVELVKTEAPSFIILDIMMPFMDGTTACWEIRKISSAPIVMLTAKIEEEDKIRGFERGADDYLCKPFSPRELVARMQAILRRMRTSERKASGLILNNNANLSYDSESHRFYWKKVPLQFTYQEAQIVITLLKMQGKVCTREHLLNVLYPLGDKDVVDRIVDVHIGNIRQKIRDTDPGFDLIETVRSIGYRLKEG